MIYYMLHIIIDIVVDLFQWTYLHNAKPSRAYPRFFLGQELNQIIIKLVLNLSCISHTHYWVLVLYLIVLRGGGNEGRIGLDTIWLYQIGSVLFLLLYYTLFTYNIFEDYVVVFCARIPANQCLCTQNNTTLWVRC